MDTDPVLYVYAKIIVYNPNRSSAINSLSSSMCSIMPFSSQNTRSKTYPGYQPGIFIL